MIKSIHQSMINMASRCGEQFRRRYIEGEIILPSIAAARGTSVHTASEVNLTYKVVNQVDMPLNDLKDATRDGYIDVIKDGIFLSKGEQPSKKSLLNNGLNDALRCTEIYHQYVAPQINPIAVEQSFKIDIGLDLPIAGRIDYQEQPIIGDLKTAARAWPKGKIFQELQPIFYSLAHEKLVGIRPEFVYNILIAPRNKEGKPTTAKYDEQRRVVTDQDYQMLIARIKVFLKMLKAGIFLPADPSGWICSSKWCGYYQTCPYKKGN
ncbi:MAG: PD-(D/E)XK nuclease family protein [Lentisphaerae bacterium]|nr:PD-(D/E)XK nuclease family protein [Lentisphaerota bacterium]